MAQITPASPLPAPDSSSTSPSSTTTTHTLPAPFTSSSLTLLTQGAEALVYASTFLTPQTRCIIKYRPPKPYRHAILDRRLTKARLLAEARVLLRCRRDGVPVPAVLSADPEAGWLVLEWVEGRTVRKVLDEWAEEVAERERKVEQRGDEQNQGGTTEEDEEMLDLMRRVGRAVGALHAIGVCHGDLTTSNLMLRTPLHQDAKPTGKLTPSEQRLRAEDGLPLTRSAPSNPPSPLAGDIILIDFGLASHSTQNLQDEDRAVDLYVLERAFAATHPRAERMFGVVLEAYGGSFKGGKMVLRRLEDVRLRGRKRSMLG